MLKASTLFLLHGCYLLGHDMDAMALKSLRTCLFFMAATCFGIEHARHGAEGFCVKLSTNEAKRRWTRSRHLWFVNCTCGDQVAANEVVQGDSSRNRDLDWVAGGGREETKLHRSAAWCRSARSTMEETMMVPAISTWRNRWRRLLTCNLSSSCVEACLPMPMSSLVFMNVWVHQFVNAPVRGLVNAPGLPSGWWVSNDVKCC